VCVVVVVGGGGGAVVCVVCDDAVVCAAAFLGLCALGLAAVVVLAGVVAVDCVVWVVAGAATL